MKEIKELENGKIYQFIEKYCKENNFDFKDKYSIHHHNEVPFDSIDRFVAFYIIENEKDIIANLEILKTCDEAENWYNNLNKNFIEEFELIQDWAYDNYERECMSNVEALYNLVRVAKAGKEYVLKDCYGNGGYFGAS